MTDEELNNCVHVCLTDQEEWDPNNVAMDLHRPKSLDVHQVMIIPDEYEHETDLMLGDIALPMLKNRLRQE